MNEKITFKTIWHEAGISALILTAVCAVEFLIETFCSSHPDATWASILKIVVELGKLVACIYLMLGFMKKFKINHPEAQKADLRKLGYTIGLISAVCLSAVMMAWYMWHPEFIKEVMDVTINAYSQYLDRNSLDVIEATENKFPQIIFFSNLFYCSLWAFILPAILAGKVVQNPFDEEDDEDDEDNQ